MPSLWIMSLFCQVLRSSRLVRNNCARLSLASVEQQVQRPPRLPLPLAQRPFSSSPPLLAKEDVTVTYVLSEGEKVTVTAPEGDNLLDIVINNDIDIDGFGACEGILACSTCHVVLSQEDFDRLPDEATDEELDMLDLAFGLTETSRLGCQVCVSKELSGITVRVPEGVNDQLW